MNTEPEPGTRNPEPRTVARRTFKLTITYDGTRFIGWQRQARGESIQGLIEEALARFEGAPVTVHGAGRTDAGVHALGQVASVQLTCGHAPAELLRGINATLPHDIRIMRVAEAAADFHARFSARSKTYRYAIRNAAVVSPFERSYVWQVPAPLDLSAMREAATALIGTHDFAAFRGTGTETKDTVRTITRSEIEMTGDTLLSYEVSGNGFLRHMVRAIVGTLVDIGRGGRPADSMPSLIASASRAEAGATAPPYGLFLVAVDYD